MKIDGPVREIDVTTPVGTSGRLIREAQFAFTYAPDAEMDRQVSVTMPVRSQSYSRGALFPVFEMNLPEGYVRRYVIERLRKQIPVDDMLFLALAGNNGIGRLGYLVAGIQHEATPAEDLESILQWVGGPGLFSELVERYLLRTTVGVSGVQPKVVVPEERGTLVTPSLIVKSGPDEFPAIAVNEFVCMSIGREAGLETPEFWLSDDHRLFVMRRFDLDAKGQRLGMEDFSVLMGRPGDRKYRGSYGALMKAASLYGVDVDRLYEQVVLSVLVGNGDAHLKNFAVIYESTAGPYRLSPVYDVVCTRVYDDHTLALRIGKDRSYPQRSSIERLGQAAGVRNPGTIIERVADAISTVLGDCNDLIHCYPEIGRWIRRSRDHSIARTPVMTR
jgi:serine/threonine-protein kinase HipA